MEFQSLVGLGLLLLNFVIILSVTLFGVTPKKDQEDVSEALDEEWDDEIM